MLQDTLSKKDKERRKQGNKIEGKIKSAEAREVNIESRKQKRTF